MSLPFELKLYHKSDTKWSWIRKGLIMDNFEEIYQKYIYATNCELCDKKFIKSNDRQMEHNHKTGEFRNIVCRKCNLIKADRQQINSKSGYIGINKKTDKTCNQGYIWTFRPVINGKRKLIKSSINLEKLIVFAEKWKKDNNYNYNT